MVAGGRIYDIQVYNLDMADKVSIPKELVELVGTLTIENYLLKKEVTIIREDLKKMKTDLEETNSKPL